MNENEYLLNNLEQCIYWQLFRYLPSNSARQLVDVDERVLKAVLHEHFLSCMRRSKNVEMIIRYRERLHSLFNSFARPYRTYDLNLANNEGSWVVNLNGKHYEVPKYFYITKYNSISIKEFNELEENCSPN
jgi:hypothetical protein